MQADIQQELERIVGGKGVQASDLETEEDANPRVKLDTAEAAYDLPANELLMLLRQLPDDIGVNALRQSIEEHFPSAHL